MRLLNDKLAQKVADLETISDRLAALLDLGQELAAEHDPPRLIAYVCRAACKIIGAIYAAVGLLEADGQVVRQFTIRGIDVERTVHMSQPANDRGVVRTLIADRRPLRLRNPSGDPQALGFPADHPPVYSFLGAPIASPTRIYGWLGLRNKLGADEFSAEDERLIATLAAQVALAYENALSHAQKQRHAAELERRVAERTAELQRSNAELEQFAYIAAHDLQEPLRKVIGYSELLAKRYKGRIDAEADEFIAYAVDGAKRMRALIQDLLAYALVGTRGEGPAPTDCAAALQRALHNLEATIEESRAQVTWDPLPVAHADGGQLVQLFQNLIGNAIKFHGAAPPQVHVSATPAPAAGSTGACTAGPSIPAPASAWRSAKKSSSATAGVSGSSRSPAAAPRSTLHCPQTRLEPDRHEHLRRPIDSHRGGGRRP
jgi:signal transduction histidine kinase